ncbi:hypothetical protein PLEOSDRAFT_1098530 [Pleurotus ostreatus PC15]|uniref:BTB domain-containing protein n=1 Tax=Pleurotus ostreatus (strain PC15) TaxID=1137138 RepID=A0A067P7W8_PLEO1|nr:hypothetical protein PLEOSDRAFT_1098530 [Pleurotus ostreatus PC15]
MSTDTQEITTTLSKALEPFDDQHADVILRSCDGTDFYVYKSILSLASPFFRAMFSLPDSHNTNPREGNKPVVDMHEDSTVLDPLLRFCYPTSPPKLSSRKIFDDVLSAAEKFEMQLCERIASSYIVDNIDRRDSPLECYALAHRFALRKLAKESARRCLELSLDKIVDLGRDANLSYMSSKDYNRLLHYCRECRDACQGFVNGHDFSWLSGPPASEYVFTTCTACKADSSRRRNSWISIQLGPRSRKDIYGKAWWFGHVERIAKAFTASGPGPLGVVKAIDFSEAMTDADPCDSCRSSAIKDLQNFSVALDRQINIEIDKIELELEF